MSIRKFLKNILYKKKKSLNPILGDLKDKMYLIIGENSITPNIKIEIRQQVEKHFLKIGNKCIVSGNFIFENKDGLITIGDRSFIGGGLFISTNKIEIGNDVLISWGCTFMDNNAHSTIWSKRKNDVQDWKRGLEENKIGAYKDWNNVKSAPIIVKDKAWIGFEVVVLKGVTVGEGSIIGSRSVVTKDIPDWTMAAGNPAQIVREIPVNER